MFAKIMKGLQTLFSYLASGGAATVEKVKDAVADSKEAIKANDQQDLNERIAEEKQETDTAHQSLDDAIEEARRKNRASAPVVNPRPPV